MVKTAYVIKNFGVMSIAKVMAVIGLIWGLLAGLVLLVSYVQGYASTGQTSLLISGFQGLVLMIVYGIIGGFIGGAIIAFVYNRALGATHGIRMELEVKA